MSVAVFLLSLDYEEKCNNTACNQDGKRDSCLGVWHGEECRDDLAELVVWSFVKANPDLASSLPTKQNYESSGC